MITLSHIGLRYQGGPEVLSDISLQLQAGSFHYLTGASGSGKTSLMRLLYLGLLPTRGRLSLFDHDVMQASRAERARLRHRIGVIFQEFRLLPHLSVYDNIALPLKLAGMKDRLIKQAVQDIVEWIGLKDYLQVRPVFLSGGQQQRVAIARAVVTKPTIILADEPTGSLDDAMGHKIMSLFEELNKQGTAMLVATHNQEMIRTFPHPVLEIQQGRLVA